MNWWVLAFVLSLLAMPAIVEVGWETDHSYLGYEASVALVALTAFFAHLGSD